MTLDEIHRAEPVQWAQHGFQWLVEWMDLELTVFQAARKNLRRPHLTLECQSEFCQIVSGAGRKVVICHDQVSYFLC